MAEVKKKPKAKEPTSEKKTPKTKVTPVARGVKNAQKNFKVALGLEGIRMNPGFYLGELGADMAYRAVKEVTDNAYDEAVAGRNKLIEVIYDVDGDMYIVADAAGGIPTTVIDIGDGTKEAIMTSAFSRSHAGGKFNSDAYKTSAGTHGVGVAAVNAVSDRIRVWSNFDSAPKGMEYQKGKCIVPIKKWKVDKDVQKLLSSDPDAYGTIVAWTLDQTIVSADVARGKKLPKNYRHARADIEQVSHWLRTMADLNPGLEILFITVKDGKRKTRRYLNEKNMGSAILRIADERELALDAKPFEFKSDYVSLAISWADYPEQDLFQSFVNTSPTSDHGWHVTGFRDALESALKPYIKVPKGKKKAVKSFTSADLLVGAVALFDWRMHGAQYTSQVKDRLASRVEKQVQETLEPALVEFFSKNKTLASKIIKRVELLSKGRADLQTLVRSMSSAKKAGRGNALPDFLTVAEDAKPHQRELFVCEGDSAGSGVVAARDNAYQEVMKATGKPLNGLTCTLAQLLSHKEVQGFLVALGADLKHLDPKADAPTLPVDDLRIGNVLFLSDADPDGRHINTLWLAVIYRLLPTLMSTGRVWVVNAPLYNALHDGKHYGGDTFEECRAIAPKAVKDRDIIRAKGWGEVPSDIIQYIACNPKTRRLYQINPFISKAHERFFLGVVGDEPVHRRRLLGLED